MANAKANIYPVQLQGAELNLNKFDGSTHELVRNWGLWMGSGGLGVPFVRSYFSPRNSERNI